MSRLIRLNGREGVLPAYMVSPAVHGRYATLQPSDANRPSAHRGAP